MSVSPPILVLGAPRSGAGAFTGMLSRACGLALGDTPPPTPAAPLGSNATVYVSEAHDLILRALERDWTCPPVTMEPSTLPLALLDDHVARMTAAGRPWAVTEPRLMFTLPAWAHIVPAVRLIGVVRSPTATTQSLVAATSLGEREAGAIVDVYNARLASLQRILGFPVIEWSHSPHAIVARTAAICTHLGLPRNDIAASRHIRPSLIHHRPRANEPNPDFQSLRHASQRSPGTADVSADQLREALAAIDNRAADALPRHLGPAFAERQRSLWQHVNAAEVDHVTELLPATTPDNLLSARAGITRSIARYDRPEAVAAAMAHQPPADAVVAAGLLDAAPPREWEGLLHSLWQSTTFAALLALDVSASPGHDQPEQASSQPTTLAAAAERSGWRLTATLHGTAWTRYVLRKTTPTRPESDTDAHIAALEDEVRRLRALLERTDAQP